MFLHMGHVQWQTVSWIFGKYGFNGNIIRTIIGQQNIDGYRIWQSSVAGWEIPLSESRFLAGKINEKLEDLTAGQSSESGFWNPDIHPGVKSSDFHA